MISRFAIRAIACAAAAALAGCAAIQTSHDFRDLKLDGQPEPVAVVAVQNSGWYLFGCLPLLCGDPGAASDSASIHIFSDSVTLENNMKALARVCEREHATNEVNLVSRVRDDLAIGLFVFGRRMVFTSAVITK